MTGKLVVRGIVVGLLAGLLAAVFAYVVGEPRIDQAIALEEAAASLPAAEPHSHEAAGSVSHSHGAAEAGAHSHGEEGLVSRGGQRFGLFLALGLYGVAVGGLFALVYAALRGRAGPRSEPVLAVALAGAAFAAIVLVPFVKYPANPPAVGDPATINQRTVLYLVAVAVGILSVAAGAATHRYASAAEPWLRWLAAGAAVLVPVAAAWILLPEIAEVPEGFPADLLWDFRVASLGTQAVFWTGVGALFAFAARRRSPV
ncbi:putative cobalt transporter CbtA [Streptosporangium becharense]|uniref:Putative cobalt transporter CbtA n=1 Tax=Streptosporangium becharense TaxID=1816182 RepID=A0A7W9IBR8_9ACTN|nr:CbtA family protein [Streptosporangium becharense]MBB2913749.1 putative cobalt transporter CbtA [Streptosporangium becharense]MBB5817830.1 putative cobalt transporter CbtA [Streptosporangium becharense]